MVTPNTVFLCYSPCCLPIIVDRKLERVFSNLGWYFYFEKLFCLSMWCSGKFEIFFMWIHFTITLIKTKIGEQPRKIKPFRELLTNYLLQMFYYPPDKNLVEKYRLRKSLFELACWTVCLVMQAVQATSKTYMLYCPSTSILYCPSTSILYCPSTSILYCKLSVLAWYRGHLIL